MFRCPECAKVGKILISKEQSILANRDMNKFTVLKEPFYTGNLAQALMNLRQQMSLDDLGYDEHGKLIISEEDTVVCYLCGHSDEYHIFKEAWQEPMDFFDAENLCSCGEEIWMDRIPNTNKFGLQCDKCGWVKPKSVVSTSENAQVG